MHQNADDLRNALQAMGLAATPEGSSSQPAELQAAVALANGVQAEEAFEWLAEKFALPPVRAQRLNFSTQTETVFRRLALEAQPEESEPWAPMGTMGPLVVMGHYNPAATSAFGVPTQLAVRCLIEYPQYKALLDETLGSLAKKPLAALSPTRSPAAKIEETSPEKVLAWLIAQYPFSDAERERLSEAADSLAGVSVNALLTLKSLPPGYNLAIRHLCTGETCLPASLAPKQATFPDSLLEKHAVYPLFCGQRSIYLLSSQKEIFSFEDEWLSATPDNRRLKVVLSDKAGIQQTLARERGNAAAGSGVDVITGELAESAAGNAIEIDGAEINRINPASITTTPEQALHWVLYRSIMGRASDLHIEKYFNMARFRARIDGELVTLFSAPEENLPRYVSLIKNYANMGQERQGAQDGRFSLRVDKKRVDCRVSAIPCRKDQQKITIRYLEKEAGLRKLSELNLSDRNLDLLSEAMSRDQGLILITGPTGSGKTTTLYALLNSVNNENMNIQTIEDPIEYEIEGINQTQTDPAHDIDFAQGLRRLMRADPDIILIGECRDEETASAAVNAALTGHLVLTTLHANDSLRAVSRFISMGVPPYLLADSLALTQAQRLVRRLCLNCKRPVAVTEDLKKLFNANRVPIPTGTNQIFEAYGCSDCRNTGYRGRIALMELCPIGREIADLVSINAPQSEMRKVASKHGLRTLYQEGLQQVIEGNTSLEEIKCLAYTGVADGEEDSRSVSGTEENFDI